MYGEHAQQIVENLYYLQCIANDAEDDAAASNKFTHFQFSSENRCLWGIQTLNSITTLVPMTVSDHPNNALQCKWIPYIQMKW